MRHAPAHARSQEFARVRERLLDTRLTRRFVEGLGLDPRDKGKWGKAVELILGITPNSSPLPDLGPDGELKTTVLDRGGRFRESIRICMLGHDPLVKLVKIVLVVARDLSDATKIEDREVVVEDVLLLEPTQLIRHALEADRALLGRDVHSKDTYFVETRTAGPKASKTRGYYLKKTRVQEYVDEIVRATLFREIRVRLLTLDRITPRMLARYSGANKGRFGQFIRDRLPADLRAAVRTGVVDGEGRAKEDLLVCAEADNPVHALRRLVYVPMRIVTGRGTAAETRRILDVVYLAPDALVVHALRRDRWLVKHRAPRAAYFLRLKTRYFDGARRWAWYLKRNAVQRYGAIVRNQPV